MEESKPSYLVEFEKELEDVKTPAEFSQAFNKLYEQLNDEQKSAFLAHVRGTTHHFRKPHPTSVDEIPEECQDVLPTNGGYDDIDQSIENLAITDDDGKIIWVIEGKEEIKQFFEDREVNKKEANKRVRFKKILNQLKSDRSRKLNPIAKNIFKEHVKADKKRLALALKQAKLEKAQQTEPEEAVEPEPEEAIEVKQIADSESC